MAPMLHAHHHHGPGQHQNHRRALSQALTELPEPMVEHFCASICGIVVCCIVGIPFPVFLIFRYLSIVIDTQSHYDTWESTMQSLNYSCPQVVVEMKIENHGPHAVECCPCNADDYGHCCIKHNASLAFADCLVPDCEPKHSSQFVNILISAVLGALLFVVVLVFVCLLVYAANLWRKMVRETQLHVSTELNGDGQLVNGGNDIAELQVIGSNNHHQSTTNQNAKNSNTMPNEENASSTAAHSSVIGNGVVQVEDEDQIRLTRNDSTASFEDIDLNSARVLDSARRPDKTTKDADQESVDLPVIVITEETRSDRTSDAEQHSTHV